jgi:hypothetical protein
MFVGESWASGAAVWGAFGHSAFVGYNGVFGARLVCAEATLTGATEPDPNTFDAARPALSHFASFPGLSM